MVGGSTVEAQVLGPALCLLLLSERGAKLRDLGSTQLHGGRTGRGHGSTVGSRPVGSGRGGGTSGGGVGTVGGVPGEGLVGVVDERQLTCLGIVKVVVGIKHTGTQFRAQSLHKVSGDHSVPGGDGDVNVELHEVQLEVRHVVDQ